MLYKGVAFRYDEEDHLTQVGSTWTATYNGDGLRASKAAAGAPATYYLYDGATPVCEFSLTGTLLASIPLYLISNIAPAPHPLVLPIRRFPTKPPGPAP